MIPVQFLKNDYSLQISLIRNSKSIREFSKPLKPILLNHSVYKIINFYVALRMFKVVLVLNVLVR